MIGFSLCDYVGGPIDPLTPGFPCQIFGRDNTHLMLAQFCPKMYNVSDSGRGVTEAVWAVGFCLGSGLFVSLLDSWSDFFIIELK